MFESFQNFIPKTAKKFTVDKELHAAYVCHMFRKKMGDIFKNRNDAHKYIKPIHFKRGTLLLSAETAGWAQEITFKTKIIMNNINKTLNKDVPHVKTIKIQILN